MHTTLLLDMAADAAPDRLALGRLRDGVTFDEVRARVRGGAAWLDGFGGDTVAFLGAVRRFAASGASQKARRT